VKEIDQFIFPKRSEPETFHPVKERNSTAWFPANEAASLVVQLRHIWEDLTILQSTFQSCEDPYEKQLFLKYVVIEVRSLIDVFDRLQGIVMKAPVFDPKKRSGWREITIQERDTAKGLFRKYTKAKASTSQSIIKIRNEIGAHRGNLDWQKVKNFWDSMEPELVNPILAAFPKAFDYAKSLDLYDWNRTNERGNLEMLSIQLRPEYFECDN
jgi:hypothetical protein